MKFSKTLTVYFSTLAAIAATGVALDIALSKSPAQVKAETQAWEASDAAILRQAGFEIVTRTGKGVCSTKSPGDATYVNSDDYVDLAYLLKKPGHDDLTYKVCMQHGNNGETNMRGLSSVEKTSGPKS